jgi:hypothetical protein
MSKSSVSIHYLVTWLLGIITLAVAAYLIYKYIGNSQLSCSQCNAELTSWCAKCYKICGGIKADWDGATNIMDDKLKECMSKCSLGSPLSSCGTAEFDFCKAYIGI